MRTIKVKVWDTEEKKWLTNLELEAVHYQKSWGNEFYIEVKTDIEDYDPTRYVFVESTGLKDRNNVEIFEFMELNGKYEIIYQAPKYVLREISTGDIIEFNDKDTYKITREYTKI